HLGLSEVPIPRVDGLELAAVDRNARFAEQFKTAAQHHELAANPADGLAIVLAEVGYGLEVRHQAAGQPNQLDVTLALPLQAPARLHTIEVAINVNLQQRRWMIGWPSSRLSLNTAEAQPGQIKLIDKNIDRPHRIILGQIVFQSLGKQRALTAVIAKAKARHRILPPNYRRIISLTVVFTQSGPICDISWFEIPQRSSLTPLPRYAILSVGSTGEQALPRFMTADEVGRMKRREFVTLIGGAAAWPIAARAQRSGAKRRIVVVGQLAPGDVETVARSAAFEQALAALGWTKGDTIAIDYRWIGVNPALAEKTAVEVVALAPDVLLASSNGVIAPLSKATGTIPIVMVQVIDPVGSGYVESMARPGGNITGFTQFEYSLASKWLDLLMEIAPRTSRVAVLREPTHGPGIGQFAVIQAMAPARGVEPIPINPSDVADMERRITAFASV